MQTFKEFSLPGVIENALAALTFHTPTPIQAQAIPVALRGRDLIGCAQTGTGKTAAFCVPLFARLLANDKESALILAPTREIALQTDAFWRDLTREVPAFRSAIVIGGAPMFAQTRALRSSPRLIIATPGRLVDHLNQRNIKLDRYTALVLDEADRMLDMGFAPQLNRILSYLPKERQTLLFSATWDKQVDMLAKKYLRDPERVTIGSPSKAAVTVEQQLVEVAQSAKQDRLLDELNARDGSVLVFLRTQTRTDRVAKFLESYGMEVGRLHGGRSQAQRTKALKDFRTGQVRVMVATDLAARGIDVAEIQHVINYDLPMQAEDYVHRIGRTGRAGATGTAVSFVTSEDRYLWKQISRLLEKSGSPQPLRTAAEPSSTPRQRPAPAPKPAPAPALAAPQVKKRFQDERLDPRLDPRQDRRPARFERNERFDRRERPDRPARPWQKQRSEVARPQQARAQEWRRKKTGMITLDEIVSDFERETQPAQAPRPQQRSRPERRPERAIDRRRSRPERREFRDPHGGFQGKRREPREFWHLGRDDRGPQPGGFRSNKPRSRWAQRRTSGFSATRD